MMINIGRRLRALEQKRGPQLPWHLPPEQWTDDHLIAFLTNGQRKTISDAELEEILGRQADHALEAIVGASDEQPLPPT